MLASSPQSDQAPPGSNAVAPAPGAAGVAVTGAVGPPLPSAPRAVPAGTSRVDRGRGGDSSYSTIASPSSFSTASFSTSMHPSFSGPFASPFTQETSMELPFGAHPAPTPTLAPTLPDAPAAAAVGGLAAVGGTQEEGGARSDQGGSGGGPKVKGRAGEGGASERQLLPPRGAKGWVDPQTGFYMGQSPLQPKEPPPPLKRRSVQGVTDVLSSLWPLGRSNTMTHDLVGAGNAKMIPIQLMEFHPGELMASYSGGVSPVLAYIESGYVQLNYQADIPVPLSAMAAMATDLMPEEEGGGGNPAETRDPAAGASTRSSQRAQHEPIITMLESLEVAGMLLGSEDRLDTLAYGSPLVDVASALARASPLPPAAPGSNQGGNAHQMQRADTLMHTVQRATHRAEQLLKNAMIGGSIDELLVSVRGPNEFLGALVALDPDFVEGRWKMHVVAKTQVRAVVMTKEGLATFLEHNPLAQVHLRAGLSQARSDVMRLETLEKLALAGEHRSQKQMAAAAAAEADASRHRAATQGSRASADSWVGDRVVAGVATLAESVVEGVSEGVASLDVFGVVAKLRAALRAAEMG